MSNAVAQRLADLGLALPEAPAAVANYVPHLEHNGLLYISGQIAKGPDGELVTGTLGADLSVEDGQRAARYCALNILAQANAALGDLGKIRHVIRLTGFVAATANFADHPSVINGASDLVADVLGDAGRHTRAAVGVASLPLGVAVEIDAILAVG